MKKFSNEEKSSLTRTFNFVVYVLDYVYKEFAAIPRDFLTETHLRFFRCNKNPNKKILALWDFNQRLARSGDFMVFLEYLGVLRHEFNLDPNNLRNIDVCFIEDENHYNASQLRFSKTYDFKKNLKSSIVVSPHVDSIFSFKSNAEFERFYQQNRKRYIRWPPTVASSIIYDCRKIEQFYLKNKFIPQLGLPVEILDIIYNFYQANVYPALPIILNIRNNPDRSGYRNSNLAEFKAFLKHYEENKAYKFIIVCSKAEIPEDFRDLSNVIFSKDYFEGIEYDLAFVKTSYLTILPSSGMGMIAWHGGVPFIELGPRDYKHKYGSPPKGGKFAYFAEYQRVCHNNDISSKWLIPIFEDLVSYLQKNNLNNNLKNKIEDKKEYESKF